MALRTRWRKPLYHTSMDMAQVKGGGDCKRGRSTRASACGSKGGNQQQQLQLVPLAKNDEIRNRCTKLLGQFVPNEVN